MDVDRPAVKDVASASTAVSSATAAAQDGSSSAAAGLSKRFESARDRVSKDKYDVVRYSRSARFTLSSLPRPRPS